MRLGTLPALCTLAVLAMLSGCASTPQQLTAAQASQIRNVAVVSLVPESVNFDKIGVISFTSQHTEFDLRGKVTDSILFVSRERIAKFHPQWTLKRIEYDRAALLAAASSPLGMRAPRAREAFAALARDQGLDAVFVVRAAADTETDSTATVGNTLREGLTVWFKNNQIDGDPELSIRANLNVAIIGKVGEPLAAGTVPGKTNLARALKAADFDVSADMKHNHRPEILDRLGREVLLDLNRRLNLGFDALGFTDGANPEAQHVNVVLPVNTPPQPKVAPAPQSPPRHRLV